MIIRAHFTLFLKEQKCSFPVFCPVIPVLWFPFAGQIRPDPEEGGILANSPILRGGHGDRAAWIV